MKLKILSAALLAAGVTAMGTAGALDLPNWLRHDTTVAATTPARTETAPQQAVAPVSAQGLVPNYRAIVKQAGPDVVGVSVSGLHAVTAEEQGGGLPPVLEDDPFFRFFKGMPGMPNGQPRGKGGNNGVPFRGM